MDLTMTDRIAYCPPFTPMHTLIPESKSGEYEIIHFEVNEEDVKKAKFHSILAFEYGEFYDFEPGKYVQLQRQNGGIDIVMSDTPMERRTNLRVLKLAKGDVLIAGLGIGMILYPILNKPEVESVTVVELERDVIRLMKPLITKWAVEADKCLRIINDDIELFDHEDRKWDVIYFDIWDEISGDNWEQMKRLTKRFKYRRKPGGWMGAWRKADMRHYATGRYRSDQKEGFVK
jgi:spermidine synthase